MTAASRSRRVERLERQHRAMTAIGRRWRNYEGNLERALEDLTELAADALGFERVGLWRFDTERRSLLAEDLYAATSRSHSRGHELSASEFPAYMAAISAEEVILAEDAETDPRTSEFTETYLRPNGIGAMLDAPILTGGRMVGVLCMEHVGGPRRFHADEVETAAFLADMIGAGMEIQLRIEADHRVEELLRDDLALWRILFEQSLDGIVTVALDGSVFEANQRFADMLGYSVKELQGLHVWDWDAELSREEILGLLAKLNEGGANLETRHRRKDGAVIDVELANVSV